MEHHLHSVPLERFLFLRRLPVVVEYLIPVVGTRRCPKEILHISLEFLLPVIARPPVPRGKVGLQERGPQRQAAGQQRLDISRHNIGAPAVEVVVVAIAEVVVVVVVVVVAIAE